MKKLIVGWFSFTCSEDSTILFTELLNQHFDEWKNLVDFKSLNPLKSKNDYDSLDVAFIEGAVSSEKQAEEVRQIDQKPTTWSPLAPVPSPECLPQAVMNLLQTK